VGTAVVRGHVRTVILNGIVIALFFWLLAAGAVWIDRRLPDRAVA
jgi:hypothetical protein